MYGCLSDVLQCTTYTINRILKNHENLYITDLEVITDVYNEGVLEGLDGDPFSLVLDLEALDIILEEESEEAIVGMGWHSECKIGLGAGWIAIDDHQLRSIILKFPHDACGVDTQRFEDGPHQHQEKRFRLHGI